jgi:membrane-associated phospholipid phosphatase
MSRLDALNPVDKLIAVYLAFVTLMAVVNLGLGDSYFWWILLSHVLIGVLLYLFTLLTPRQRAGQVLHDFFNDTATTEIYTELAFLNVGLGLDTVFAHDAIVQGWEEALFGEQISYTWIRNHPSVFWSGLLHVAYVTYYPIVYLGPILLLARGKRQGARNVLFATMVAYLICYTVFIVFPVAGPNWVFDHPTGPVRDVWSARMVYGLLGTGSSVGTAFPSSHVAATFAAVFANWREWRTLAVIFLVPASFMAVATVYCQMHYAVDALVGLALAVAVALATRRVQA